jgi:stress-induced morphogen
MNLMQEIQNLLLTNVKDSIVRVADLTGTMDHLDILVASDEFIGKSLIDQHQIIMDILKGPLSDKLHAVKIKTMNLEKYNKKFNNTGE